VTLQLIRRFGFDAAILFFDILVVPDALGQNVRFTEGESEFAYPVGLPGKSGVGGGILAVAPGKSSIAVWSPGLRRRW
jgi:hypothetical protein